MPAGQANVNLADIHLSLFAQHSTNKVKRALRGDNIEAPVSRAQKRKFANVMRAPRACFEGISVKATSGQPVTFYAGNIGKILEYTASHIPTFRNKIYSLEREETHKIILTMDESTSGNVLQVGSTLKMALWYFYISNFNEMHRPSAWLPLAAIPSKDLQFVAGGMSAVAAALLRFIAQQSIEEGIWIQQVCRKFRIWSLVADYDALRMVYNSKGAAASKPCMQCKNICGNWMSLPETDPYFHSIDCADFRNFDMISNAELHHAFDTLKPNLATWRKKQRENTEKGLGYNLDPHGLLHCPIARNMLPVRQVLYDTCHNYFANGIGSQEIILFQEALTKHTAVTREAIQKSVCEVNWKCSLDKLNSQAARKKLFQAAYFTGTVHKGSATHCWYLLPLLCFYGEQFLCPALQMAFDSFIVLQNVTMRQCTDNFSKDPMNT